MNDRYKWISVPNSKLLFIGMILLLSIMLTGCFDLDGCEIGGEIFKSNYSEPMSTNQSTPLHRAIKEKDINGLKCILDYRNTNGVLSVNLNVQDTFGYTPLHWAVNYGSFYFVQILTNDLFMNNSSINLNKENIDGQTPLDIAEYKNFIALSDYLRKKGALGGSKKGLGEKEFHKNRTCFIKGNEIRVNQFNEFLFSAVDTAMHAALRSGNEDKIDCLSKMLEYNEGNSIDLDQQSRYDQKTILHLAIEKKIDNLVLFLTDPIRVKRGKTVIDLDLVDMYGMSVLHEALKAKRMDYMLYLTNEEFIKKDLIDINAMNGFGRTVLNNSITFGYYKMFLALFKEEYILKSKLDINLAQRDITEEVTEEQEGGTLGNLGKAPLHLAIESKDIRFIKKLLSPELINNNKINLNIQDHQGLTPLHYIVKHEKSHLLSFLANSVKRLESPSNDIISVLRLDVKDREGNTPIALLKKKIEELEKDYDPNIEEQRRQMSKYNYMMSTLEEWKKKLHPEEAPAEEVPPANP